MELQDFCLKGSCLGQEDRAVKEGWEGRGPAEHKCDSAGARFMQPNIERLVLEFFWA